MSHQNQKETSEIIFCLNKIKHIFRTIQIFFLHYFMAVKHIAFLIIALQ